MEALEFAKGHGTGNDFVIIPDPDGEREISPRLVAALCDRRYGVGGDGLLRVVRVAAAGLPPQGDAEWFMDYRNADGSVAEMCGNGVRVFARYLVDSGLAGPELAVATRTGVVTASVTPEAVSVTLGAPRLAGPAAARVDGLELSGTAVDCGNPHLVCPLPAGLDLAALDLTRPPAVDPGRFPHGVNVEFTSPGPDPGTVRIRVHERGVGETRSCGSGACAVAAVVLGEAGRDSGVVTVESPGGALTVSLGGGRAVLTGPAVLVARGTVMLDALP
jgi:diaminopimelate epimerase